jgi:Domain of unknown function (DUF4136)
MNRINWYKTASIVLVTWLMLACSHTPRIHAVYEPGVSFERYKTFSFMQSLEPKGEEGYLTINDRYLRQAIVREMNQLGFVEAKESELLVGYNVTTKEKISSTTFPSANTGVFDYRGRYGYGFGVNSETRVNQFTEGTLNIDVVDKFEKLLLWQGVAVGRMKNTPPEHLKAEVDSVVAAIFAKFPTAMNAAENAK